MKLRLFVLVTLATATSFVSTGCSDGEGETGDEGSACYANGTCNDGLVCRSDLCVDPDPDSSGAGGGDSQAGVDLDACFGCGEADCSEQSDACSSSDGCRNVLECWLDCAEDTSCRNACDTSDVTSDDLAIISDYFTCLAQECAGECAATAGGNGTGGSDGSGGSGGSGGSDGAGGSDGTGGGNGSEPTNLVQNGNFADELEKWNLELQAGVSGTYSDTGGEICVNNTDSVDELSFTLGYPTDTLYSFEVSSGTSYTFSFRARGYAAIDAKVGQAVSPYDTIQSFNETVASGVMTSFSNTVTPASSELYAGIAFNVVLGPLESVCFRDVLFIEQ